MTTKNGQARHVWIDARTFLETKFLRKYRCSGRNHSTTLSGFAALFHIRASSHRAVPNGFMPFLRTVFRVFTCSAQDERAEVLEQSPSGAQGSVTTQLRNLCRSSSVIDRSATRSRMCSHNGRGKLAKRIFGNRGSPEDRTDQIFANGALLGRISFGHKSFVGGRQSGPRCRFRLDAPFGKGYQRPAHGHVPLLRHPPDFARKLRGNRYTLAHGGFCPSRRGFASCLRHNPIIAHLHHCGAQWRIHRSSPLAGRACTDSKRL